MKIIKWIGIILGIVIVFGAIGLQGFISWKNYKLKEEKQKTEQQEKIKGQQDENRKNSLLNVCLRLAETSYGRFWDSECKILGRGEDCFLPEYNADRADDYKQEEKDECYKRYR